MSAPTSQLLLHQLLTLKALILMVSRIVLALQYLLIMWHVRKYENAKLPFILIAGVNLIAAAVYLGVTLSVSVLSFSLSSYSHFYSSFSDQGSTGYRSFYVIAIFEIATNIVISSKWKVATFKGTHLVQRMSLLTLIILGEGVMTIVYKLALASLILDSRKRMLIRRRLSKMKMHGIALQLGPSSLLLLSS